MVGVGDASSAAPKPKRVRTGCLTCRERHLKCDEALPHCQNCKKSNRTCKRGIRLNFIDTQVQALAVVPASQEWNIGFVDESREIASEYKGGLNRYSVIEPALPHPQPQAQAQPQPQSQPPQQQLHLHLQHHQLQLQPPSHDPHQQQQQSLPPIQVAQAEAIQPPQQQPQAQPQYPFRLPQDPSIISFDPNQQQQQDQQQRSSRHSHAPSHADSAYSGSTVADTPSTYTNSKPMTLPPTPATPPDGPRNYVDSQEELLFMQVFVEEVGLWMDSMDPSKHFSRLLPFHAMSEPMLLNAFLACGARHLSLVNAKYTEDRALHYYDTATRYLLNSLQNPNRDVVICATTAVILNVYEIMCERALQRMNHIAGARALIKECGWNATSTGVGAACFWLNVGMELLSCLHFNWQVAWDPDEWALDMDFSRPVDGGREEIWTYRIVYIVAKIGNFRATIPRQQEASPRNEHIRLNNRYNAWRKLKDLADAWHDHIPRTMHPLGYLFPGQTLSQSAFPEVWLIKRTTIVARLFYHTAMVLLAQINPVMSPEMDEMRELQQHHSKQICGIVAHVKDRGVASVALRSLAIAAECLVSRREQEEVLQIFDKIRQETGWRVGFLNDELKVKWGWNDEAQQPAPVPVTTQQLTSPSLSQLNSGHVSYRPQPAISSEVRLQPPAPAVGPPPPARTRPPAGILNPLLAAADFSMPQHPYQSYYVPANPIPNPNQYPHY